MPGALRQRAGERLEHSGERPGRLLGGRYRLIRPIGSGGMGAVYAAIDERLGGEVALKLLRARASPSLLERFRREARLTATLGNPHIVRITDFHENPGEPPFIVMERIDGMSLKALIETAGPLPARRACAIAAQILSALGDAHDAGILHRDVKPANVLVSSSPAGDIVKVVDFGLARLDEAHIFQNKPTSCMQLTAVGELVGTAGYVAPEHLRGEPIDHRVDIYAVGATLFQMLSGKKAFDGMSLPYWMATAQRSSPRLDEVAYGVDPALVEVVARAMAVRQADRYSSATEMIAALTPWTTDVVAPQTIQTPVPPDFVTLDLRSVVPPPIESAVRTTQVIDPSDMETTLLMTRGSSEHHRRPERADKSAKPAKSTFNVGRLVFVGLVLMLAAMLFVVWKLRLVHEHGLLRHLGRSNVTGQ
jgi:serine/threonine protein kinase